MKRIDIPFVITIIGIIFIIFMFGFIAGTFLPMQTEVKPAYVVAVKDGRVTVVDYDNNVYSFKAQEEFALDDDLIVSIRDRYVTGYTLY